MMDYLGGSQKEYVLAGVGGIILCIATSIHLLFKGRVTGLAGYFFAVIKPDNSLYWRLTFFSGIILASSCMVELFENKKNLLPKEWQISFFDPPIKTLSKGHFYGYYNFFNYLSKEMIIGAYLIGLGTKLSNGCTSGHGICGLPRLSIRSIVAVLAFMFTGVLIATLKYNLGFSPIIEDLQSQIPKSGISLPLVTGLFAISMTIFIIIMNFKALDKIIDIIVTFIVGFLMCLGINLAGMGKSSKVINFLTIKQQWDPSLMFIMGGAVLGNFITFYIIVHIIKKPLFSQSFQIPTNKTIDWKLLGGALIFGLGWGICGICPGFFIIIYFFIYSRICNDYIIIILQGAYFVLRYTYVNWIVFYFIFFIIIQDIQHFIQCNQKKKLKVVKQKKLIDQKSQNLKFNKNNKQIQKINISNKNARE